MLGDVAGEGGGGGEEGGLLGELAGLHPRDPLLAVNFSGRD